MPATSRCWSTAARAPCTSRSTCRRSTRTSTSSPATSSMAPPESACYGKHELLDGMRPYQGGGEMIDTVTLEEVTYNAPPHRFEAGTPPIVQAVGLGAAIGYVEGLGREAIAAHEHEVASYAAERLKRINSLRLIGDAPSKG